MNTSTLKEKFLNMPPQKKAIIREYCRLYSDLDLAPDKHIERISSIWNRASDDPELITYLELADYIYADVNDDECLNDDKRAYLCEHLISEIGLQPQELNIPPDVISPEKKVDSTPESLLLQCPTGEYVTVRGKISGPSSDPDSLKNWSCSQCNSKFAEHKIVSFEGVSPDS